MPQVRITTRRQTLLHGVPLGACVIVSDVPYIKVGHHEDSVSMLDLEDMGISVMDRDIDVEAYAEVVSIDIEVL